MCYNYRNRIGHDLKSKDEEMEKDKKPASAEQSEKRESALVNEATAVANKKEREKVPAEVRK